jgi:hypothetical protein
VLGETDPNRRFLIAGTSAGMTDDIGTSPGNGIPDAALPEPANGTIFNRLSAAEIALGSSPAERKTLLHLHLRRARRLLRRRPPAGACPGLDRPDGSAGESTYGGFQRYVFRVPGDRGAAPEGSGYRPPPGSC